MAHTEVKVKEIVPDPESEGCFRLVLEDVEGGLELPLVISALDARPLLAELEGTRGFRPQTHDLFQAFIDAAGYRLERFDIRDFRRGVFYGAMSFGHNEAEGFEMDCRPTDGVALALRSGAGIYVDNEVIRQVGILLDKDMGSMKVSQRIRIMEEKLQRLVGEERYEEAGILRDRINQLKTN